MLVELLVEMLVEAITKDNSSFGSREGLLNKALNRLNKLQSTRTIFFPECNFELLMPHNHAAQINKKKKKKREVFKQK